MIYLGNFFSLRKSLNAISKAGKLGVSLKNEEWRVYFKKWATKSDAIFSVATFARILFEYLRSAVRRFELSC